MLQHALRLSRSTVTAACHHASACVTVVRFPDIIAACRPGRAPRADKQRREVFSEIFKNLEADGEDRRQIIKAPARSPGPPGVIGSVRESRPDLAPARSVTPARSP